MRVFFIGAYCVAKRVHQLAKELDVKSTAIVSKCQDEGLVVKNHMSTLTAGLEATIREWFSDGEHATTVETTARVDLTKVRVKQAMKRVKKTVAAAEEPAAPAEPEQESAQPKPAAKAIPGKRPKRVGPKEIAAVETSPEAEPTAKPEMPVEPIEVDSGKAVAAAKEQPGEPKTQVPPHIIGTVAADKREEPAPKPEPHVPTPAKLQGPKVIRLERPETVARPARRPARRDDATTTATTAAPARAAAAGSVDGATTAAGKPRKGRKGKTTEGTSEEESAKHTKTRSQRRRGGHRGDGRELVGTTHEWGDRDLQERQERLAQASASKLHGRERRLATSDKRGTAAVAPMHIEHATIKEPITVKDLSAAIGVRVPEIIGKLLNMGVMATVNENIDADAAATIALEFGVELTVEHETLLLDQLSQEFDKDVDEQQLRPRPPVVAFLGHVDHGKTSLLDYIRKAKVVSGEAGGITQHIGSYLYDDGKRRVTFLDTPGHAAFTAMRARGANMTDIVVLVVAGDDGVMPQTIEAINHAKAAEVPIVVALNKIDLPETDDNRVYGQLAEHGLVPAMWGGDTEVVRTSAITGEGVTDLIEHLDYVAELNNLSAMPDGPATGWVIEAEMTTGQGVVARLLVKSGQLNTGNVIVSGASFGRIRTLIDASGRKPSSAGPATPVAVAGLEEMPVAGDRFFVVEQLSRAKQIADQQRIQQREKALAQRRHVTLENLFSEIAAGDVREFNVILKADVQGSVDVLTSTIMEMNTPEVAVRLLHAAVGGISESDVLLAAASDAIIIGFHIVADEHARVLAEQEGVEIRLYRVIYQISEDIHSALEGMLAPHIEEKMLGSVEVRQLFRISRLGVIAGCYVTEGVIQRSAKMRLIRDSVVIRDDLSIESLRRVRDDASEVRSGLECGIKLAGYDDIKVGDRIDAIELVEVSRTLESVPAQDQ
ncbi:MAG: translation initiation factor IF-2 [Alphaproteobacteria bacterium]